MTIIKRNRYSVEKDVEKLEPSFIASENVRYSVTKLPYDPAFPLLGIYLGEFRIYLHTPLCIN